MQYQIRYTDRFKVAYSRLNKIEKDLFAKKLRLFVNNLYHPSLRTKEIQGTSLFEWSVNMDIRVIWFHEGNRIIALLDIGHHSVLNKY